MRAATALVVLTLALSAPPAFSQEQQPQQPAKGAKPPADAPAQVRGVLLEQAGTPAHKHQVAVRNVAGDLFTSGPTGVDGSFVIAGLPPDTYRLAVFGPDGSEYPVVARQFTLAPGQTERLEIRITGEPAPPGRTPAADAQEKNAFSRFLASTGGKIALVTAGVAMIAVAASGDDDEPPPPVSPSMP
jgi:hypothetical protein